ncbi:MAG: hypothetical protein HRO68_01050 [Nitrosopumilus sp.]|nr:hypothetical protein [Nitrosopumilus sp.]
MNNWIIITAKFNSSCYECGETIQKDETVYWKKHYGVKHYPECIIGFREDKTELIIHDKQDEDFYLR